MQSPTKIDLFIVPLLVVRQHSIFTINNGVTIKIIKFITAAIGNRN